MEKVGTACQWHSALFTPRSPVSGSLNHATLAAAAHTPCCAACHPAAAKHRVSKNRLRWACCAHFCFAARLIKPLACNANSLLPDAAGAHRRQRPAAAGNEDPELHDTRQPAGAVACSSAGSQSHASHDSGSSSSSSANAAGLLAMAAAVGCCRCR